MYSDEIVMRRLAQNPKRALDNARRGSKQDLVEITNYWTNLAPELLNLDVLLVFFGHLQPSLIPPPGRGARTNPTLELAWISLMGLTKLGNVTVPRRVEIPHAKIESQSLQGWEGVYKWCLYLYTSRVKARTDVEVPAEVRRGTMDLIGGVIYSLSRNETVRKTMVETEGSIEFLTRLWIDEDAIPFPTTLPIPVASAALDALLTLPDWNPDKIEPEGDERDPKYQEAENKLNTIAVERGKKMRKMLDRVVAAAGGNAQNIVELMLSRLRTATASDDRLYEPRAAITVDLIGHLSRTPKHPLRLGFLNGKIIVLLTKLAVRVGNIMEANALAGPKGRLQIGHPSNVVLQPGQTILNFQESNLQGVLIASLGYLSNNLESTDGFSWVAKTIQNGFLNAWLSAGRHMHSFESREDAEMVCEMLQKLIPRYMVYKTVVMAIDGAMRKAEVDMGSDCDEWKDTEARNVWVDFKKLAIERYFVGLQMKAVKKHAATCDNVNCQKVDAKNTFRKCSSCSTTLYCSRECQKIAWKEGGHKIVCQLKQQEILEGKYQIIPKEDSMYFHHLSTRDARRNLPYIRRLAAAKFPDIAANPAALVIEINYLKSPPIFSVHPLAEHEKYSPQLSPDASVTTEARNDELIERARKHPGKFAIIQSKIANGQSMQSVLSVVSGAFWEKEGYEDDEDDDTVDEFYDNGEESYSPKNIDGVDIQMARLALNGFLRSMGQPETF